MEPTFAVYAAIPLIAFFAELVDSTLGMGYGTMLTPLLLLMGFEPLQIVPAVLVSELGTGLLAGAAHHVAGNVNFRGDDSWESRDDRPRGLLARLLPDGASRHLRIALILAGCGTGGAVAASLLALSLPKFYLNLYIAVLITAIGVALFVLRNRQLRFSWGRLTVLGLLAAFNKGISGGGYGPVVVGGQLLSGVDGKHAIGITCLAEGLTCMVGVAIFLLAGDRVDWSLAPYLVVGALASAPVSVWLVKTLQTRRLRMGIAAATLLLGMLSLWKAFG